MYLDSLHIAPAELLTLEHRHGELTLSLTWSWEDTPVLLDLSPRPVLRWDHLKEGAGLRTRGIRWTYRPDSAMHENGRLILSVTLPRQ